MIRLVRPGFTVLILLFALPLIAIAADILQTQSTKNYNVTLVIGPNESMLMPDAAKGATDGEVMAPIPGMPMADMPATDGGHPVNHHLEVHLVNRNNGQVVTDTPPTISVTDIKAGTSRAITPVAAMYGVTAGPSDLHFGGNLYLADGTYTIAVTIGGETATFTNLKVVGSPADVAPTPTAMAMATPTPAVVTAIAELPKSGELSFATTSTAAAFALVGVGVVLLQRTRRATTAANSRR